MENPISESQNRRNIQTFARQPIFAEAEETELFIVNNPFRRPTRAKDLPFINLDRPLALEKLATNTSLALHRMLLNIYETDLLFLPPSGPLDAPGFDAFYGYDNQQKGELARPHLEYLAFRRLEEEIEISGKWNPELLIAYFRDFLRNEKKAAGHLASDPVCASILRANDSRSAAIHYLVQLAVDYLSEASAMARLAPGAYGPLQSALFNVLVDEYGAAVHEEKHSTLFAKLLSSIGLETGIHYYWQFYQPSFLALTNYFHYVTKNKTHFFRYLGALFFTETSLVNVTFRQSQLMRKIFGDSADTHYFDEHTHIDRYHGETVLERLIVPAIQQFGARAIEGILRGFEEFRLLQKIADEDLRDQFDWAGHLSVNGPQALAIRNAWETSGKGKDLESFTEILGERSTTHIHPDDRLLMLETGEMDFFPMAGVTLRLKAGDVAFIPEGRLHGSIVRSEHCLYHQPIITKELLASLIGQAA